MNYPLTFLMLLLYIATIYGDKVVDHIGAFISIVILPYVLYDLLVSGDVTNEVWARSICAGLLFAMAFVRLLLRAVQRERLG